MVGITLELMLFKEHEAIERSVDRPSTASEQVGSPSILHNRYSSSPVSKMLSREFLQNSRVSRSEIFCGAFVFGSYPALGITINQCDIGMADNTMFASPRMIITSNIIMSLLLTYTVSVTMPSSSTLITIHSHGSPVLAFMTPYGISPESM